MSRSRPPLRPTLHVSLAALLLLAAGDAGAQPDAGREDATALVVETLLERARGPFACDGWRTRTVVRDASADAPCRIAVEARETICTIQDCFWESTSWRVSFEDDRATVSIEDLPTCESATRVRVDFDGEAARWRRQRNVDGVYDPVEEGSATSFSVLVGSRDDAEILAVALRSLADVCRSPDAMGL